MLQLENISKSFAGVKALRDISLSFKAGEVHAVCGENGAGKSTLMNIISGNLQPDTGAVYYNGAAVRFTGNQEARAAGISIVYQERSLVDFLSVAENIYPVDKPVNRLGLIDHRLLNAQARQLLDELELHDLPVREPVYGLSASRKQMVEIAKALSQSPRLLILDEPTASLTTRETGTLFRIIRALKNKGVSVIYISHRMQEIAEIADRVSVLKDGRYEGTFDAATTPVQQIMNAMVGRELQQASYQSAARDEPALQVAHLSGNGFHDISFTLHKGEILGLAGLEGAGRTALALALFADEPVTAGTITKGGKQMRLGAPGEAMRHGIAYVPDDRKALALFMENNITDNIASARLAGGMYNASENHALAGRLSARLGVRSTSVRQVVNTLSGGNQQKVVLAKWMSLSPDIWIINEPTHGVDVGAKAEIYAELQRLTEEGKSILLISSELPELLLLSDRIMVMHQGGITGMVKRSEASEQKIISLASGFTSPVN